MSQVEAYGPADGWDECEDDSEDGICTECKEHASPVYERHIVTGYLKSPLSSCCGAGIWLP